MISSRSFLPTTSRYQPSPSSFPLSLPTNPLSLCVDNHCLITTRSFTVVLHVHPADGSVPRLLVRAVPEGSGPRPRLRRCCDAELSRRVTPLRGEYVYHEVISRYRSLEVHVRHPRDVPEDGSLAKATLIIK
jgi:hypothetical protein